MKTNTQWLDYVAKYPNLALMLAEIAYDNGTNPAAFYDDTIVIDVKDPSVEKLADMLTQKQVEVLCTGEETEIVEEWKALGEKFDPLKRYIDFVCYQIF